MRLWFRPRDQYRWRGHDHRLLGRFGDDRGDNRSRPDGFYAGRARRYRLHHQQRRHAIQLRHQHLACRAKNVLTSTLPPTAQPVNLMPPSSGLWATDLNGNVVDQFTGSPEAFQRAIPVTGTVTNPNTLPMFIAGSPTISGEREYVISQNVPDTAPMTCNQIAQNGFNERRGDPHRAIQQHGRSGDPGGQVPRLRRANRRSAAVVCVEPGRRYSSRSSTSRTIRWIPGPARLPAGCTNQNGQTDHLPSRSAAFHRRADCHKRAAELDIARSDLRHGGDRRADLCRVQRRQRSNWW